MTTSTASRAAAELREAAQEVAELAARRRDGQGTARSDGASDDTTSLITPAGDDSRLAAAVPGKPAGKRVPGHLTPDEPDETPDRARIREEVAT